MSFGFKKVFYFLFFLCFFFNNIQVSYSNEKKQNECFNNYHGIKKEFQFNQITIETENSRKWYKNILSIYKDFTNNDTIDRKYKKNHKVSLIVNYLNGKSCKYKAKIRVTGLSKFHFSKENFLTSLDVKLVDGHINNITAFKLLMPESRSNKNEIFITTFLKTLGFVVPKTNMVKVKFNDVIQEFIFQEKFNKEFLESYKLREGPIYLKANQGDDIGHGIFKIENSSWIKKDFEKFISSSSGFKKINEYFSINQNNNRFFDTNKLIDNDNKLLIENYHAALMSLNAFHGLSLSNQVFYYDIAKDFFIPIYNDGKGSILDDKNTADGNFFSNLQIYGKINFKNNLTISIKKIDQKKLRETLKKNGLSLNKKTLRNKLKIIVMRLDEINKLKTENKANLDNIDNEQKNFKSIYLVDYQNRIFKICDSYSLNCNDKNMGDFSESNLSKKERLLRSLLKQNLVEKKHIYWGSNLKEGSNDFRNFVNVTNFGEFKLYTNSNIQITERDKKNRILKLKQIKENGRAIITGNEINNWRIKFEGVKKTENYKNFKNITGCITFLDINVNNLNLYSESGICEDNVNFIRANGVNNILRVNNAFSDGVDLDFSNISFDRISVKNSKNDCLDFSGGDYKIYDADLNLCGDKAISVGELSNIKIFKSLMRNSNIGIASKDGSNATVLNTKMENVKFCAAAYKKKQEFSGGYISINKLNCEKYSKKFFVDKFSKINEKGES